MDLAYHACPESGRKAPHRNRPCRERMKEKEPMCLILFRPDGWQKRFRRSLTPCPHLVLRSAVTGLALFGSLFSVAPKSEAQTYTTLYSFQGPAFGDGQSPFGALFRDENGDIYGTTDGGGIDNYGTLFKVTASGQETVLFSFTHATGANPLGGVTRGGNGNLFGTNTNYARGNGSWFELNPTTNEVAVHPLWPDTQGNYPNAGMVADGQGNTYSTAEGGGNLNCAQPVGCGVVFEITPSGQEKVVYAFTGRDGAGPDATLGIDKEGNLYGTTYLGGHPNYIYPQGCGVVFKVTPSGGESVLYAFKCGHDGTHPESALFVDDNGNVYGVSAIGGKDYLGCIFKLTPQGRFVVLHSFSGVVDGWLPSSLLTRDRFGNLYGIAGEGGVFGCGTIFKLDTSGAFSVLYAFPCPARGAGGSGLTLDDEGNLYGTTYGFGGQCSASDGSCGTVFKLTP